MRSAAEVNARAKGLACGAATALGRLGPRILLRMETDKMRVAMLDDYQGVALTLADWASLPPGIEVDAFGDHLTDETAIAERLRGFDIVVAMRERTPFPASLLGRLPNLRLLVTTGAWNASIDVAAATERRIVVCGTRGLGWPTAELT